ncbi:MAG: hypothetical protein KBC30_01910 [Planctomycetes bacterium]|nr:hypothetical protein [Planctomycetota bacterium]
MLWGSKVTLGKQSCSGENMLLWGVKCCSGRKVALGKICSSGENKKIGKKGENFTNFLKNWRDFGKIRGNFRRFCSEKKAIWKAIGRIFW